ncbi:MAG: hypothetical protein ISP32_05775 [Thermoleophilia bacterium]|nr:hypothetical protein [Thermoleophilia bacterium]
MSRRILAALAPLVGACAAAVIPGHALASAPANATLSWGTAQALVAPLGEQPRRVEARMFGRMSLLYETDDGVRRILGGSPAMQSLPWLFRIEPSTSGPGARLGAGNDQRMVKVSGAALAGQPTAEAMAAMLRGAINRTCTTPAGVSTCTAHRVAIDEIDSRYGGRNGQRGVVGMRLRQAMVSLSRQQSRWGGSYASRVQFVVAPGPATSVAAGYGPNRSLGRNGLPIRRNYRDAFAAMSLGGGVWIQMYHYSRTAGLTGFTAAEWRDVPTGVASFLRAVRSTRNPLAYLHVVLTTTPGDGPPPGAPCSTSGVPGGPTTPGVPACVPAPPSCAVLPWVYRTSFPAYGRALVSARAREDAFIQRRAEALLTTVDPGAPQVINQPQPSPMACQWDRAQGSAANVRVLMNGPAAYRLDGDQAVTWGVLFRQFFLIPPTASSEASKAPSM